MPLYQFLFGGRKIFIVRKQKKNTDNLLASSNVLTLCTLLLSDMMSPSYYFSMSTVFREEYGKW